MIDLALPGPPLEYRVEGENFLKLHCFSFIRREVKNVRDSIILLEPSSVFLATGSRPQFKCHHRTGSLPLTFILELSFSLLALSASCNFILFGLLVSCQFPPLKY